MCQNRINQVTALLETYPDMRRKIAVLRYELEHPATVSPDEMIDALSFARGDGAGRSAGHVSNKTLYIAMNYQTEAARLSGETMDEIVRQLIPLERETERLEHYVSLLQVRQVEVIRLYYFEQMPWDELSRKLNTSAKTLRRLRNDAVKSLSDMYDLAQGSR